MTTPSESWPEPSTDLSLQLPDCLYKKGNPAIGIIANGRVFCFTFYPSVAFGDSSPKGELDKTVFLLITKSDLTGCDDTESAIREAAGDKTQLFNISAKEGMGLEQLAAAIRENALSGVSDEQLTEGGVATEWEAYRLREAVKSVSAAAEAIGAGLGADCATIDLTAAVDSLGGILGLTASEDVVDHIFSRFCVGK